MSLPGSGNNEPESEIKFQICNDLHVNFWIEGLMKSIREEQLYQWIDTVIRPDLYVNSVNGIILAGDVAPILWSPVYIFMECLVRRGYDMVIWIPGNHEYLSEKRNPMSIEQLNQYAQEEIDKINNRLGDTHIYWLPHGVLDFTTFNIIGTTLWSVPDLSDPKTVTHHMFNGETDPCIHTPGGVNVVRTNKFDYGIHITDENGKTVPLNPINYRQLALSQRAWLLQQYKLNETVPLIVVTHYPAGRWMDQVGVNKRSTSMYVNDLPINFFPSNLVMWVSGHTHHKISNNAKFGQNREVLFLSNPVGYPKEYSSTAKKAFDPGCIASI